MKPPVPKPGTEGSIEHFTFIERSDRRNLHTQLKNLVSLAKNIAIQDLNQRREKLRKLIEGEDKMFEEEFANSAKARLQSEMKERTSRPNEDAKKVSEFLKKKRVQQRMNCCYEVREAIRQRNNEETRICLEEQIAEKERETARQRELDKYWLRVQQTNLDRQDVRQRNEECFKEWRRDQICHVLGVQLEEKEAKLEEERKEKAEEVDRINRLLEELRLEEIERQKINRGKLGLKYRTELLDMVEEKRKARQKEELELCAEHRQLIADIAREEKEAAEKMKQAKQLHKETLLDYIDYVKRMRQLEENAQIIRYDRIEDLRRVDICTKRNYEQVAKKKAEEAAKCYAELRRQVCEQLERQKQEGIEQRENKMLENRFAHPEVPRSVIIAKREQFRKDLDKQILEIKRIRTEEEEKYKKQLMRAMDDPEYCEQMIKEFLNEGADYLDPHPNWLILLDPCKEYIPKAKGENKNMNVENLPKPPPREPFLPTIRCTPYKDEGPCQKICPEEATTPAEDCGRNTCIIPCGCIKRWRDPC